MQSSLRRYAPLCASLLFAACGGSGKGLDENGDPASAGGSSELTATFESIQENVFTPICTACHIGAGAPHGLRLDAASSYALLVGVPSDEVPGTLRVAPGNPNASYIIQKLSGTASVGQRMPLGGPYLSQATIDVIKQWIANGAPQSVAQAPGLAKTQPEGLHLTVTQPLAGAVSSEPVNQIVLSFDRELDASLVNSATVTLENLSAVDKFIPVQLSVAAANPATVIVKPLATLPDGEYRVSMRGNGSGGLATQQGVSLGHDVALEFSVAAGTAP